MDRYRFFIAFDNGETFVWRNLTLFQAKQMKVLTEKRGDHNWNALGYELDN
jgi:hypothetical protein